MADPERATWEGELARVSLSLQLLAVCAGLALSAADLRAQSSPQLDIARQIERARETTLILAERLRGELTAAIKSDGAASAIGLCQTISPDLTTIASDEYGFDALRTALKLRNPENAPDAWERRVLELFQAKVASGADPTKLEHHEVVTTAEGEKLFRYMRPIMTTEMCLHCHGSDIKPDVRSEITRYYPDDKAVGFKVGDLRGAFSLAQLIEE
jgi:hypothetical protein